MAQNLVTNKRPKVGQLWEIGLQDCGDTICTIVILGKSKEFIDVNRIDRIWRWKVMLLAFDKENGWRWPFRNIGDIATICLQDKDRFRPLVL